MTYYIGGEIFMNKAELVEAIAKDVDLSKVAAQKVLDALLTQIKKSVVKGDPVQLIGFGSFGQSKRAARTGRNPQTGAKLKIAAAKTVKFSAGKAFKDAVNKKKA